MKRNYSRAFEPPAPTIPLEVHATAPGAARLLEGKLDTGADICAVPESVIVELGLAPVGIVRAAGYAGELRQVATYRIDVGISGVTHRNIKAVSTKRPYLIVGRNVLAFWVLRLDGPHSQLELRQPAAGTRRTR